MFFSFRLIVFARLLLMFSMKKIKNPLNNGE